MVLALERYNAQLAYLERASLAPHIAPTTRAAVKLDDKDIAVERSYQEWVVEAGTLRLQSLFERVVSEFTEEVNHQLMLLEQQAIALMYRTNAPKPDSRPFATLRTELSQILTRYKQNPDLYPGGDGQLTAMDRNQIEEACLHFPVAVEALIRRNPVGTNNDPWTTAFVKFCLRSPGASKIEAPHWVRIFFELPREVDQLMSCALDKRLGATDPRMLQILHLDGTNALYMKVHGAWQKIQGSKDAVVSLPNCVNAGRPNVPLPIGTVYKQMKGKRCAYNGVEVFQKLGNLDQAGIVNWDSAQLGSLDPVTGQVERIDVTEPNWMYQLPVWRSMELHEVQERYPDQIHWSHDLPHDQRFALAMCATREEANLDIANNHAYFEVVVPEPGQSGRFRVFPFGFQALTLPDTVIDRLWSLQNSQPCILHYPDESAVLSQRQRYSECFMITPAEFANLQDVFSHYVQKSREGKEVFQATGSNCGKHAQKTFDDTLGQRFYEPFTTLANAVIPGQDARIHDQIKRITKALDDEVLEALSSELVAELIERHDYEHMAELLSLCLNTLSYSLKEGQEIEDYKITVANAQQKIEQLYQQNPENADELMRADLKQLIQIAIHSQQFYKISIFDVEVGNPILGPIVRFIQGVQWEWLRSLLVRGLFFLLGSWRGYTYQKADGTYKTVRVWNHSLHGRVLNLPAQAFNRPALRAERREKVGVMLGHLPA